MEEDRLFRLDPAKFADAIGAKIATQFIGTAHNHMFKIVKIDKMIKIVKIYKIFRIVKLF